MSPPPRSPFEYAVIRVVPRVERGEQFNAGIVLGCRVRRFLGARVELDEGLLASFAPDADVAAVRAQLETLVRIAEGARNGGPIAALPAPERFHWLVSPSSTIVQPSAVHTGMTDDPEGTLERLFDQLVRRTA